jgi:hypothetical protein
LKFCRREPCSTHTRHLEALVIRPQCVSEDTLRHLTATIEPEPRGGICEGDGIMAHDAHGELLDHLLSKQRRYAERRSSSQEAMPAIKMLVGEWYTDELGILTREIRARD